MTPKAKAKAVQIKNEGKGRKPDDSLALRIIMQLARITDHAPKASFKRALVFLLSACLAISLMPQVLSTKKAEAADGEDDATLDIAIDEAPGETQSQKQSGSQQGTAESDPLTSSLSGLSPFSYSDDNTIGDYTDVTFYVLINKQWTKVNQDGTLYDEDSGADYVPVRITGHDSSWGGADHMIITGDVLYNVYKNFGFTSEGYHDPSSGANRHGYRIFANTIQGGSEEKLIWADGAAPWYSANDTAYSNAKAWQTPLRVSKNDAGHYRRPSAVFYIPNNKKGNDAFFDNSAGSAWASGMPRDNAAVKAANTFYSLSVTDPDGVFSGTTLPSESYVLTGNDASVTLPTPTGDASWHVFRSGNASELVEGTDYQKSIDEAGKTVLSFTNVTAPIIISTSANGSNRITFSFDVSVANSIVRAGVINSQSILVDGELDNGSTTAKLIWEGSTGQIVPWPKTTGDDDDPILATTADNRELNGNKRKLRYAFEGWKAEGSDTVFGKDATLADIANAVGNHLDNVKVEGVWTCTQYIEDEGERINTVNFYVSLSSKVMSTDQELAQSNYSASVAASFVGDTGIYKRAAYGSGSYLVSTPMGNTTMAYDADHTIRRMDRGADDHEQYKGISIYGVPDDEDVMRSIREEAKANPNNPKAQVTLDGVQIDPEDLTTDNFSIRWYTMKYHKDDGWHVDGILVHKTQDIVVTKTFLGDPALFAEIAAEHTDASDYDLENAFSITSTATTDPASDGTVEASEATEARLILRKAGTLTANDSKQSCIGYSSMETSSTGMVTYRWKLPAASGQWYNLTENNTCRNDDAAGGLSESSWYRTYNIDDASGAHNLWENLDSGGVAIKAVPQDVDIAESDRQTVAFRNLYAKTGTFTLFKIDENSNDGLANIVFDLEKADGTPIDFNLIRKKGTSVYTYAAQADDDAGTTVKPDENGRLALETDADGFLFAELPQDTYYLKERIPDGYVGATTIKLQVNAEGEHTVSVEELSPGADETSKGGWVEGAWNAEKNMGMLTVKNRSEVLLTVTAQVKWGSSELFGDTDPQIASVFLHCNGSAASDEDGDALKAVFEPSETVDGLYLATWKNLPLYVDGKVASYTLYEQEIGADAYNRLYDIEYNEATGSFDVSRHTEDGVHGFTDYRVSYGNAQYAGALPQDDEIADKSAADTASTVAAWVKEGKFDKSSATWTDDDGTIAHAKHLLLPLLNTLGEGTISFQKTGEDGTPLQGATFELYEADPETSAPAAGGEHVRATSDENGMVTFTHVVNGTTTNLFRAKSYYYFREVSAPNGYALNESEFRVRVHDRTLQERMGLFPDGSAICDMKDRTANDDGWETTVTNRKLYTLPTAGGPGILWPTLAGTVFMCVAVARRLMRRRTRTEEGSRHA